MKRLIKSKSTFGLVKKDDDILLCDTGDVPYLSFGDITVASYIKTLDSSGVVLNEDQCREIGVPLSDVIATGELVGSMTGCGSPNKKPNHSGVVYTDDETGSVYQYSLKDGWFIVASSKNQTFAKRALVLNGDGIFDFINPSKSDNTVKVKTVEGCTEKEWSSGGQRWKTTSTGSTTTTTTNITSDNATAKYYYIIMWGKILNDKYNAFIKSSMRSMRSSFRSLNESDDVSALFKVYTIVNKDDIVTTVTETFSGSYEENYLWEYWEGAWSWRLRLTVIARPYSKTTTSTTPSGGTFYNTKFIISGASVRVSIDSSGSISMSCTQKKLKNMDITEYGMDSYTINVR